MIFLKKIHENFKNFELRGHIFDLHSTSNQYANKKHYAVPSKATNVSRKVNTKIILGFKVFLFSEDLNGFDLK